MQTNWLKEIFMKIEVIEVINSEKQKITETYSVPNLSMYDFQEWQIPNEVVIDLNQLLAAIANLDSKDPETDEPISNPQEVDFYLPDPIKNRVLVQLVKSETATGRSEDQIRDEVTERISMPKLKSSTILAAVVTEILQNHHPPSNYKVRISDG